MPEPMTPREILARLVAFPTVSRDTNLPLIDWVEGYLSGHGIRTFRHWNEDRSKAALIAHAGPWEAGAVVLSGHSDVVPVDGQAWTSDPWTMAERDGRLYGRGTCDMKGYVALAIWALAEAQRSGVRRPLQLALSYDEEVGCTGAPPMIETMRRVVPRGSAALVGEPSGMKIVTGHKGGTGYHVHVKGYEVHSSLLPEGVSAIMEGARLIQWVNDRNAAIQAGPRGPVAAMFRPPFSTLHVGMIAGGTAHNITAADCRFAVEMRVTPDDDIRAHEAALEAEAARLDAALKARRPEAGVMLDRFFGVPALRPEADGEAEAIVRRITGDNAAGVVSYGTEAGQFQDAGYSCVVCGPGDIAQAHQADEFIEVSQFQAGWRFMQALVRDLQT
jgi:acetylornithine deacetylase